jgi:hypothetical protein
MNKETIKNFNIVLSKIEKFSEFSTGVILSKLLTNKNRTQKEVIEFNRLVKNVFTLGTNEDFFIKNGEYPWGSLTKKGKKAKKLGGYLEYEKYIEEKELESKKLLVNNGIIIEAHNNKGNQSFEKIEVIKNKTIHNINPTKNPSIWERIISICVKFWWLFIIPLAVTVIGILINKGLIKIGI